MWTSAGSSGIARKASGAPGSTQHRHARFKHGPSALASALNFCGSILITVGPALRDLAVRRQMAWPIRVVPGSGREPNGSLLATPGSKGLAGRGTWLEIECEFQARVHLGHQARRDLANTLGKVVLVKRDQLRHDGRRVLWQPGNP